MLVEPHSFGLKEDVKGESVAHSLRIEERNLVKLKRLKKDGD